MRLLQSALLICLASQLSGCRASPLYIGNWGKSELATAPAAVPRDGRGEPILDNLPPLGPIPEPAYRQAAIDLPQL